MKDAIIVDLDNTLCDTNYKIGLLEERPKKFKEFYALIPNDPINDWCLEIIERFAHSHKIIYVTGREGTKQIMEDTLAWLEAHDILDGTEIYFRKEKDYRHDIVVKKEIYDAYIKDLYKVSFVLEDRKKVVDMWRSIGLTCLQCCEGDY